MATRSGADTLTSENAGLTISAPPIQTISDGDEVNSSNG